MQVGVHVVADGSVQCDAFAVFGPEDELLDEPVALAALGVCLRDVLYRDGFGTIVLPYPVGVGEVDAYRRGRIAVAAEYRGIDDFRRYPFHLLFPVFLLYGRVVFKPLCIGADDFCATGGIHIFEVHHGFPRCLVPQGVAIHFRKAVHEIHHAGRILHPEDVEPVVLFQVAGIIERDERLYRFLLDGGGHFGGLFEPIDYLLEGGRIHAVCLPDTFRKFSVLLDEL